MSLKHSRLLVVLASLLSEGQQSAVMKYHRLEQLRVQLDNAQQGPNLGSLRPYKP